MATRKTSGNPGLLAIVSTGKDWVAVVPWWKRDQPDTPMVGRIRRRDELNVSQRKQFDAWIAWMRPATPSKPGARA